MNQNNNYYDVIVIGSGMGGLAAASILAQMNKKRVLVLEQHFVLGGQTHTFSRRGENKSSLSYRLMDQTGGPDESGHRRQPTHQELRQSTSPLWC